MRRSTRKPRAVETAGQEGSEKAGRGRKGGGRKRGGGERMERERERERGGGGGRERRGKVRLAVVRVLTRGATLSMEMILSIN